MLHDGDDSASIIFEDDNLSVEMQEYNDKNNRKENNGGIMSFLSNNSGRVKYKEGILSINSETSVFGRLKKTKDNVKIKICENKHFVSDTNINETKKRKKKKILKQISGGSILLFFVILLSAYLLGFL